MKKLSFAALIWVFILTNIVYAHEEVALAQDSVTVTGKGFIDAEPDMLDLRVDFFATKPTLKEAKAEVDQRYNDTLKAIKRYNVNDTDIKLTRINSQVEYDWNNQKRIFKGYRVSRNLLISIREIEIYSELLQSLVNAGISNINNAIPRFADDTVIKERALEVAVKSAKRKAIALAKQFDRKLGQVAFVSEGAVSSFPRQPVIAKSRGLVMEADNAQVAPPAMFGTQRINATVNVVYRLQ